MGKSQVRNFLRTPPSPLPLTMAKTSSSRVKTTSKPFVSPPPPLFSMAKLKLVPPPPPVFVEVKLQSPPPLPLCSPLPFCSPPPPVISDQSLTCTGDFSLIIVSGLSHERQGGRRETRGVIFFPRGEVKRPMTSTTVNNTTKASYPQVASAVALIYTIIL